MPASPWRPIAIDLRQDIRITCRSLLRSPLLALTIIATVGLGIGATTAMFAVVDAALLRPLPYPAPDELVRIYTDTPPFRFRFSQADYLALEAQQTTFSKVAVLGLKPALRLDRTDYALTGVMPPAVGPLELDQDFFIAARWDTPRRKGPFFITALGRVPDQARASAAAELKAINKRIFPLWKASYRSALSLLIGALSSVALMLAVVGIYGVMAHYVQQHAKDISIRLALGGQVRGARP